MIYKCPNGRPLIVSTRGAFESELNVSHMIPCVVLLTAWEKENASLMFWMPLIRLLLDNGTSYFACIGKYSESLHDEIDDFLYKYDEELGVERSLNIVTTYHDDESVEDIFSYFVYGTELRCEHGCLVAILGDFPEDIEMSDYVKSHVTLINEKGDGGNKN